MNEHRVPDGLHPSLYDGFLPLDLATVTPEGLRQHLVPNADDVLRGVVQQLWYSHAMTTRDTQDVA